MGNKWLAGFVPTAKQAIAGLIVIFATAVVTAVVTSHVNRTDNFEMAYKNQELDQLQKFQTSAKALDSGFQVFNDAISDNSKVSTARQKLREAISQHAADAYAYKKLFGESRTEFYLARLGHFRDLVDGATDPKNAIPMAQSGLDLIKERNRLIAAADKKIDVSSAAEKRR